MARLRDFRRYLDDRKAVLQNTEDHLCQLQSKYESFFAEVAKAREDELVQLIDHTVKDRNRLPDRYLAEIDSVRVEVEKDLEQRIKGLEETRTQLLKSAEDERRASLQRELKVRQLNTALDREEELLKARNQKLLDDTEGFNLRIREMGKGFGFFSNLFKMRRIAAEKEKLVREHHDVSARIEKHRQRWQHEEKEHVEKEGEYQENWIKAENEAAAMSTKLESLRQASAALITRTTVERVLARQEMQNLEISEDDPLCSRCHAANPSSFHFCHICAQRLGEDQADFDGSIREISEINRHFERFSEGMTACQEIIGLVRGMKSGVVAFTESVADVEASEKKYPLPKLDIEVPQESADFGLGFDVLLTVVQKQYSLHPKVFAGHIAQLTSSIFTEEAIKSYFERMGEELSKQADTQWA